jgi:hypothetical protein
MNSSVNVKIGLHSCINVYNFPFVSFIPKNPIQINKIIYQVNAAKQNEPLINTTLAHLLYANHSKIYKLCLLLISGIYKYELTKKQLTAITNNFAIFSGSFINFCNPIKPTITYFLNT